MYAVLVLALLLIPFMPTQGSASDARAGIGAEVADMLGVYLVSAERRDPREKVSVTALSDGSLVADISYWRSLRGRNPDEEVCNAYTWILLGRGSYGQGASAVFEKIRKLQRIRVEWFDVEFGTKRGKKSGEVLATEKGVPYLRIAVDRTALSNMNPDWKAVRRQMEGNPKRCVEVGGRYLSSRWLDEAYVRGSR